MKWVGIGGSWQQTHLVFQKDVVREVITTFECCKGPLLEVHQGQTRKRHKIYVKQTSIGINHPKIT